MKEPVREALDGGFKKLKGPFRNEVISHTLGGFCDVIALVVMGYGLWGLKSRNKIGSEQKRLTAVGRTRKIGVPPTPPI